MTQKKPARIPGYKAVSVLGKGTQGIVYKGSDEATKKPVAIKVLAPSMAKVDEYKARFLREAESARKLTHPNIVKAIAAGEVGELLYYVMEFAEGRNLNSVVEESGPLDEKSAIRIAMQAADALGYAHERNLIHRDVKPGNFILAADGTVKLLDLGLAKDTAASGELTVQGSVFGTANYISPEAVHDSKGVDARSDIFSLGATLYKVITGTPPFEGLNSVMIMNMVCTQDPKRPCERNPKISKALERVVWKTMAKKPGDRYASCAELKEDLQRVLDGKQPLAPPCAPSAKPGKPAQGARKSGVSSRRQAQATVKRGFISSLLRLFGLGK